MSTVDGHTYPPDFKTTEQYLEDKLFILENHLMIHPTKEEREYLATLKTQTQIDNAIRRIMSAFYDYKY